MIVSEVSLVQVGVEKALYSCSGTPFRIPSPLNRKSETGKVKNSAKLSNPLDRKKHISKGIRQMQRNSRVATVAIISRNYFSGPVGTSFRGGKTCGG
jgi:hypothetical protein